MVLKDKKIESSQFLNENIPFSQVLLVSSKEEKEIISRQEALNRAKNLGLDLFCVAPTKNPPVYKLIDYQKHVFELSKKNRELEKFRFVLDYKISELKRQINPKKTEIKS